MSEKIKTSYRASKNIYDDFITQGAWWSRLYFKFFWGGVDDNEIARRTLNYIPDDFKGRLLDVPIGTAVFTWKKYQQLKDADITGLDYSEDMLSVAEKRFQEHAITHVKMQQGDVGNMPFADGSFDIVLSMNGFHVFPDKGRAFSEMHRVLRKGGKLVACFFIKGKSARADWLARNVMARKGWFTLPIDGEEDVRRRLTPCYRIEDFHVEGSMLYFCATKK